MLLALLLVQRVDVQVGSSISRDPKCWHTSLSSACFDRLGTEGRKREQVD